VVDLRRESDIQPWTGQGVEKVSLAEPDGITGDAIPIDPHAQMVVTHDGG